MSCDYVARGESDDEIARQAGMHAQQAHKLKVTPELEQRVRGLIHDESSQAHQKAVRH